MQQDRRHNPYPWTWEIPAAIVAGILLAMALAIHPARALANLTAAGTWQLTPRPALFRALPGIVTGDATAGLSPAPAEHASAHQVWFWIAATELVVLVAIVVLLRSAFRRWGPGRVQGMANPSDADQLLGISRLRHNAAVIRPDLHPGERS